MLTYPPERRYTSALACAATSVKCAAGLASGNRRSGRTGITGQAPIVVLVLPRVHLHEYFKG